MASTNHRAYFKGDHKMSNGHQAAKIARSNKTDEYTTPGDILQFAREILEVKNFDLDPATMPDNNTKANKFFTKADDGLTKEWVGKIWINPPFSKNKEFIQKAIDSYHVGRADKIIYLTRSEYRTTWARMLLDNAEYQVIYNGYTRYGGMKNAALFSTVLYTFGVDAEKIREVAAKSKYKKFVLTSLMI